jgi:hypothetical protein
MADKFTIESLKRIYHDDSGEYVQISPDADGFDCVEIRQYDSKGEICGGGKARITMPPDMAEKVVVALQDYLADLKKEKEV